MKKRSAILLLVLCGAVALLLMQRQHQSEAGQLGQQSTVSSSVETLTFLSQPMKLDRLYQSMLGPASTQRITISKTNFDELLWITGLQTDVVGPDGKEDIENDFFCHTNLALTPASQSAPIVDQAFRKRFNLGNFFFTLVPGRMGISLPAGFGLPLRAGESLDLYTMSLNQTVPDRQFEVRFRTELNVIREQNVKKPLTPLFFRAVTVTLNYKKGENKALEDLAARHEGTADTIESCAAGTHQPEEEVKTASGSHSVTLDEGRTAHWLVPPGRHTYRSDVTETLNIPYDTKVHYVTGHLHPHGELIELIDRTEERTVFSIRSKDADDKPIVAGMEEFSLPEGVPIYKDHRYELVATYDNTTSSEIDAMGMIYLYLQEKEFASQAVRYMPIGDSYTIGNGVAPEERWPNLLTARLRESGIPIELVGNPARSGWTTADAIADELPVFKAAKPDFATVLIGSNDLVRGVSEKLFREQFGTLLDGMLQVLEPRGRLLVVTLPDFSVTPAGKNFKRQGDLKQRILAFNAVITQEANKRGLSVADIFEISQKVESQTDMLIEDDLHPSAKLYKLWEEAISPAAQRLLSGFASRQ